MIACFSRMKKLIGHWIRKEFWQSLTISLKADMVNGRMKLTRDVEFFGGSRSNFLPIYTIGRRPMVILAIFAQYTSFIVERMSMECHFKGRMKNFWEKRCLYWRNRGNVQFLMASHHLKMESSFFNKMYLIFEFYTTHNQAHNKAAYRKIFDPLFKLIKPKKWMMYVLHFKFWFTDWHCWRNLRKNVGTYVYTIFL